MNECRIIIMLLIELKLYIKSESRSEYNFSLKVFKTSPIKGIFY